MWWIATTPPRRSSPSVRARYASISAPPAPDIRIVSARNASSMRRYKHEAQGVSRAPRSPAALGSAPELGSRGAGVTGARPRVTLRALPPPRTLAAAGAGRGHRAPGYRLRRFGGSSWEPAIYDASVSGELRSEEHTSELQSHV